MKKKIYKFIISFIIIVALCWYLFYFDDIRYNFNDSKRFNLLAYKSHSNILKTIISSYYAEHGVMPKTLNESLVVDYGRSEIVLYCYDSVLKSRLSNPMFPLCQQRIKKRFKYSYVYDKAKKSYIVILESPFENRPKFKSLTFKIPKGYKEEHSDSKTKIEELKDKKSYIHFLAGKN